MLDAGILSTYVLLLCIHHLCVHHHVVLCIYVHEHVRIMCACTNLPTYVHVYVSSGFMLHEYNKVLYICTYVGSNVSQVLCLLQASSYIQMYRYTCHIFTVPPQEFLAEIFITNDHLAVSIS